MNQNFSDLNVKVTEIGRFFKIDAVEYKFVYSVSYGWSTPGHNSWDSIVTTPHPRRKGLGVLLSFDKTFIETIDGIDINLNILGYYSRGPSGPFAEVIGNIGDKVIKVKAFNNGTVGRYDRIEDVVIGKYLFHAHYGLYEFYLTVFKERVV